ncbi:uncharacterized protein LOC113295556 [Papaver somniferum]|uniref:uncharacterized protein LOC113295556 n=1 Tax=Papaver somniferum TaxID=3469 RepID=UPI000E6F4DF5|nr:uncharacterized protein LOC113295556 [Papaver somniferum]
MGEQSVPVSSTSLRNSISFADMVKGKQIQNHSIIDISSLLNPVFHDDKPSMEIPLDFFQEGCAAWNFSLIGRLDFRVSRFTDVKKSLEDQWSLGPGRVKFTPMYKGFFIIKFSTEEDKLKIRDKTWKIDQQELHLRDWFPWFDPNKEISSHAAVWVDFPVLYVELWTEKVLLSLGKNLGTPIMVDKNTLNHEYGCYAAILIDIDFTKKVPDSIHVTVDGRSFDQFVELQKIPKFCSCCRIVGHVESDCRRKTKKNPLDNPAKSNLKWQPVNKTMREAKVPEDTNVLGVNQNSVDNNSVSLFDVIGVSDSTAN